jgi:hypothetical protein
MSRAAEIRSGRHWALMGQGPCSSPHKSECFKAHQFKPLTPPHTMCSTECPRHPGAAVRWQDPGFWPSRLERGAAMPKRLARAARRMTRSVKGQAAALRRGPLAEACTRARVLVHGHVTRSSGDRRRGSMLPARRGATFRANTCKQTCSGRSPACTHQSSPQRRHSRAWIAQ